jgi:hypothetical protein
VQTNAKHFANVLNHCLDGVDAPHNPSKRAAILSKMLDIPRHEAFMLVEGKYIPNHELIEKIANEFDIDPKELG